MRRALDIQTFAATAFLGSFIAAESAARLLEAHPGSALAWRLNLGVFRAFEQARLLFQPSEILFSRASLPVALVLLLVLAAARTTRCRLAVALFANLSFLCSLALLGGIMSEKLKHAASLSPAALAVDTQVPLVAMLVVVSLIGFVVCHWSFLRGIADLAPPGEAVTPGRSPVRERRRAFQPLPATP